MKPKQIVILSVIFGILAFGILLKSWVRSSGDNASAAKSGPVAVAGFDPAKLERIRIGRGGQTPAVELAKKNGVWKVTSLWNAKANRVKVESLIEKLRSAGGELRGSGKKFFADFGIQDTDAFSIGFFGPGNTLLQDLRIGTKQAGENAYFIRKAAREEVYLVDLPIAELLGITTDFGEATPASLFWADLSLFDLDPEKVTKITVQKVKDSVKTLTAGFGLVKDPKDPMKSSWTFLQRADRSYLLDPEKVLRFIAILSSLRAQQVADPAGKNYSLEKPAWEIAVTEGGRETVLSIGGKDEKENGYFVRISGDPAIFILGATYMEDLGTEDVRFAKEAPKEAAPGAELSGPVPQGPGEPTS